MTEEDRGERTLAVAEEVAHLLKEHRVSTAIIGGIALAIHGYPRATRDLDLGALMGDPSTTFPTVASILRQRGMEVDISMPDASDPLGGVMTIRGEDFDPIQVVNFYNPDNPRTRSPGGDAINKSSLVFEDSELRVVDLGHLIALKLYAGGRKSELDVLELLAHNEGVNIEEIREICGRFGLDDRFGELLKDL